MRRFAGACSRLIFVIARQMQELPRSMPWPIPLFRYSIYMQYTRRGESLIRVGMLLVSVNNRLCLSSFFAPTMAHCVNFQSLIAEAYSLRCIRAPVGSAEERRKKYGVIAVLTTSKSFSSPHTSCSLLTTINRIV